MTEQIEQQKAVTWITRQTANILGIILTPRRTLGKVVDQREFWAPLIIISLTLAAVRVTMLPEALQEYSSPEFRQKYMELRKVSEEEAERNIETIKRITLPTTLIEAPIVVVVGTMGLSFILFLVGRLAYRGTAVFKSVFTMVAWSSIVSSIPLFLTLPLKLINPSWVFPSSPALLLSESADGSFIQGILMILDPFLLWQVILLSIGLSVLYNVTLQRAVSTVGTMYICFAVANGFLSGMSY